MRASTTVNPGFMFRIKELKKPRVVTAFQVKKKTSEETKKYLYYTCCRMHSTYTIDNVSILREVVR